MEHKTIFSVLTNTVGCVLFAEYHIAFIFILIFYLFHGFRAFFPVGAVVRRESGLRA